MAEYRLRRVTEDDVATILPWRNHPDVRRFMYTQHEISVQEHHTFFDQVLHDPAWAYYLGLEDDTPIWVVAFRDIDALHATATWGFYARPDIPRGTGRRMLTLALDQAFDRDGLAKVSGEAFAFNQASIRLHLRLGFSVEGILRGHRACGQRRVDVVRMGMLARHWTPEHTAWLRRTGEARPDPNDPTTARRFRVDVDGDLASMVVNHLAANAGRVTSLHLEAHRAATHQGPVELVVRRAIDGDGAEACEIDVFDANGIALAEGRANVLVTEEVA